MDKLRVFRELSFFSGAASYISFTEERDPIEEDVVARFIPRCGERGRRDSVCGVV